MAGTLGELLVKIGIDASSLKAGIDASIKNLGNIEKAAQKSLGPTMEKIGAGFMAVGSFAVTGFGAAMTAGIGMNASLEQSKVAFTTMLGSAEKADAFLKEMRDFANATPFEFNDLQNAAKKMLAFGFSAEQVKPMLTAVGDAVAGLGGGQEMIDRVTLALGQMQAKGKVSAEEMNQLTETGIPGWQMLADKMGLTTAEVMKLSEKGLIPADQAITALTEGMEKKFGGMMEKQSKTMSGLFSALKGLASSTLTQISAPIFDILKGKLDGLMSKVKEWEANGSLQAWADNVSAAFTNFWAIGEKVFNGILGAGKWIIDNWGLIGPILGGVLASYLAYNIIVPIVDGITFAMKGWKFITTALAAEQGFLNFVLSANPIGAVVIAIGLLVAAGILLYQNWDIVKAKAIELWNKIKDNPLAWIVAGPIMALINAGIALYQNWDTIKAKAAALWATIQEKWEAIKSIFTNSYETLKSIGYNLFNNLWEGIKGVWDSIKTWVDGKIEWLKEKLLFWRNSKSEMSEGDSGGDVGNNAQGTSFWKGGLTWVGEDGPELLNLPRGSQIIPNHVARNMGSVAAAGAGPGDAANIYVQLDGYTIAKAIGQPLTDIIRVKTGLRV